MLVYVARCLPDSPTPISIDFSAFLSLVCARLAHSPRFPAAGLETASEEEEEEGSVAEIKKKAHANDTPACGFAPCDGCEREIDFWGVMDLLYLFV